MTKKNQSALINVVSLMNDHAYHDGTSLGQALQLSRTAIWKIIKKLKHYAIQIDSIKGKGYALLEPLILLEAAKIKQGVEEAVDVTVFESIGSTNDYVKSQRSLKTISICLAEHMTKGRGRLNREWVAPFGRNIYLSCLYPFQKDVSELAGLSLVMSLAIIKTLQSYGIKEGLCVKWPNDIVYENKKMSGILIEVQAETHGHCQAIIGVGINVNMLDDAHAISQAWTSMQKICGVYFDRNEVCARLINHLLAYLKQFSAHGFAHFANEWMMTDCLMHRTITVKNLQHVIQGEMIGVNEQGHLLLQLADGSVRALSAGDTSLVKTPSLGTTVR